MSSASHGETLGTGTGGGAVSGIPASFKNVRHHASNISDPKINPYHVTLQSSRLLKIGQHVVMQSSRFLELGLDVVEQSFWFLKIGLDVVVLSSRFLKIGLNVIEQSFWFLEIGLDVVVQSSRLLEIGLDDVVLSFRFLKTGLDDVVLSSKLRNKAGFQGLISKVTLKQPETGGKSRKQTENQAVMSGGGL
jgi:hypothetical protein